METALDLVDPREPGDGPVETLERACRTIGLFRIPLDVVAADIRNAAWDDAARFFAQDLAAKNEVGFPEPGYPYGYSPVAFETLAASNGPGGDEAAAGPDLKESFSVGPDCLGRSQHRHGGSSDPAEAWLRSPSLWPAEPARLRQSWPAYYRALSEVAAALLSLMARALDLPGDHFAPLIDRHTGALRALHYPALPAGPTAGTGAGSLRASAHSDYGTLTILRTDGVAGLEFEQPDGSWTAVADDPATFVVNLGDSIAQWTNDRWRSTVHRVTTVDPAPRRSMAFFHMANWDATIECLPTCLEPGETPRHQPVRAGPWLMSKFQRTVG